MSIKEKTTHIKPTTQIQQSVEKPIVNKDGRASIDSQDYEIIYKKRINESDLKDGIRSYFQNYVATLGNAPTKSGLILHLGVRKSQIDSWKKSLKGKAKWNRIQRAYQKIETLLTERLVAQPGPTGLIFYLKCAYQWKERDYSDRDSKINIVLNSDKNIEKITGTPEQIKKMKDVV